MTVKALLILLLIVTAIIVAGSKLLKPRSKAAVWAIKARSPVSPVEQQLFHRITAAFPDYVVLSQVAVSQLVSVLPGPGRQVAFNKICRLVADFVLCTSDFEVVGIIELDDSSHAAAHRQNADRNKSDALAAAGYKLVRFQASKLPTVAELQTTFPMPDTTATKKPTGRPTMPVSRRTVATQ